MAKTKGWPMSRSRIANYEREYDLRLLSLLLWQAPHLSDDYFLYTGCPKKMYTHQK